MQEFILMRVNVTEINQLSRRRSTIQLLRSYVTKEKDNNEVFIKHCYSEWKLRLDICCDYCILIYRTTHPTNYYAYNQ